jgi:hypothetical protein
MGPPTQSQKMADMPRSIKEIVDDLNEKLRLKGGPIMTMTWPEFYSLCGITRFKDGRAEAIVKDARDYHGLFIGWGKNAVFVQHDRNFDP